MIKKLQFSDEEKVAFVKQKRNEIYYEMKNSEFSQIEYINNPETTFRMTSCVKCFSLGVWKDDYYKQEHDENEVYCDKCNHEQDDFLKRL